MTVGWPSYYVTSDNTFYACLTLAAMCDSASDSDTAKYLDLIGPRHAVLAHWAELCPQNYAHKDLLVQAELARLAGKDEDAIKLYDLAIDSATSNGFIRDMGMTLAEMLNFEELAAACAADGVYDFFYAGPPLQFTRGVGSPINPLAIR